MAYDYFRRKQEKINYKEPDIVTVDRVPNVPIDYKIVGLNDKTNLDLILFRCQTCPFCCKMIAYLNSKGLSYSVVSVDEPFERRVKWSHYKQVPCVLARTKDGKYIELTNSSVVISILAALTNDPEQNIEDLAKMYPKISYVKANGVKKHGIVNKYDLMYNGKLPKGVTLESIHEEFRWRDWADHQFVHMVYPNIYRTHAEALETYNWFSELGKWDQMYPSWMTYLMVHAGATYMFLISKRLKKRHHLWDDVRAQFYEVCNKWTDELDRLKTPFHGGKAPDLADLAVFGAMNSFVGCQTFTDLMNNTRIKPWFDAMKENAEKNRGTIVAAGVTL
ncbi:prostaglandin E synthase 2-like [Bradysia coprophila]|uniref:prostaglandin E synthase 2-like n=1 Tax=Bradysia coprophila TaxID=38358 RepID=UPI00187D9651|nr:prostaglandin E synthase 2-like [Bradysia coprophila]